MRWRCDNCILCTRKISWLIRLSHRSHSLNSSLFVDCFVGIYRISLFWLVNSRLSDSECIIPSHEDVQPTNWCRTEGWCLPVLEFLTTGYWLNVCCFDNVGKCYSKLVSEFLQYGKKDFWWANSFLQSYWYVYVLVRCECVCYRAYFISVKKNIYACVFWRRIYSFLLCPTLFMFCHE